MSHGLAALDRIILFIVGLVALLAGLAVILLWAGLPEAQQVADRVTFLPAEEVTTQPWYNPVLGVLAVLGILLGLWLLLANLRRRGFNKVRSSATDTSGSVDLAVARLAGAVDDSLTGHPDVEKVNHRVAVDRSRPTVTWTLTADPTVDMPDLVRTIEQSETDFREAVRDMDVDTTYKVHLKAVQ